MVSEIFHLTINEFDYTNRINILESLNADFGELHEFLVCWMEVELVWKR